MDLQQTKVQRWHSRLHSTVYLMVPVQEGFKDERLSLLHTFKVNLCDLA
jgi:hypothetical protein